MNYGCLSWRRESEENEFWLVDGTWGETGMRGWAGNRQVAATAAVAGEGCRKAEQIEQAKKQARDPGTDQPTTQGGKKSAGDAWMLEQQAMRMMQMMQDKPDSRAGRQLASLSCLSCGCLWCCWPLAGWLVLLPLFLYRGKCYGRWVCKGSSRETADGIDGVLATQQCRGRGGEREEVKAW